MESSDIGPVATDILVEVVESRAAATGLVDSI